MGPRPNGRGKFFLGTHRRDRARRQWGRGQTAAERRVSDNRHRFFSFASIGPRPNGRGKHVSGPGPVPRRLASMGPRPNGRGKKPDAREITLRPLRQWGRGQTAAESTMKRRSRGYASGVNGAAAKRPRKAPPRKRWLERHPRRQWGRGQTAAERGKGAGPRPWPRRVNGAAAKRPRKAR